MGCSCNISELLCLQLICMLLYCLPSQGEGQIPEGKQDLGGCWFRNPRLSLHSALDLLLSVHMGPCSALQRKCSNLHMHHQQGNMIPGTMGQQPEQTSQAERPTFDFQ